MDEVDREMSNAERQASRGYAGHWAERAESRASARHRSSEQLGEEHLSRHQTTSSTLTSSSGSSTETELAMNRIATAQLSRRRTANRFSQPVEVWRTETHRLQQVGTVGAGLKAKSRTESKVIPAMGGGKPFPPDLPPYEDYVVEFDGPDDPLHPQNWRTGKKIYMCFALGFSSICSTFASSLFSASTGRVEQVFGIGEVAATLTTSLYVLGYAFGPLIWAPFSELKGRKIPISIAMFGFTLFNFAGATAFNTQTLMLSRFFAGCFGSAPLACVAASFADMFDNKSRGPAIVCFSSTVFLGPLLAPFIGGFIETSYLGWRWNLYLPGIMGAASFLLLLFVVEETYAPVILVSKAAELRRLTKNWGIHAKQEEIEVDLKELVVKNFGRPLRMLLTEPIMLAVSIYMSFIYSFIYLFLTAYPLVFEGVHGMSPGIAGLPFFGMVVGVFCIATYIVFVDAPRYNKKLEANDGVPVPEWRLPPVMVGGVLFTIGLFWFGWTGYLKQIPWIVPTLAGIAIGCGLLGIFISLFNYIIDSYLMFAASAIAANTFMRSCFAAGFPLFSRQMFVNLGINWAATLLGCLAAIMIPIPVLFYFYGKKLRQRSKFAPTMKPNQAELTGDENHTPSDEPVMDMVALAATKSRAPTSKRNSTASTPNRLTSLWTRTRTNGAEDPDLEKDNYGNA